MSDRLSWESVLLAKYPVKPRARSNSLTLNSRKNKKRTFRNLWNLQINALARQNGITYSRLIEGLKSGIACTGPLENIEKDSHKINAFSRFDFYL